MWDLQDLIAAENLSKRTSSSKRASTSAPRRTSLLGGFRSTVANIENDGMYTFNPHTSLKLDKAFPTALSKISSLAFPKHPYFFSSNYMLMCSKNNSIAFIQNRSSAVFGEESEKSSTVSGIQEKACQVDLVHEISVVQLFNKYVEDWMSVASSSGSSVPTPANNKAWIESLKVYSVHTVVSRESKIVLTTSYGPLVLSLHALPVSFCLVIEKFTVS